MIRFIAKGYLATDSEYLAGWDMATSGKVCTRKSAQRMAAMWERRLTAATTKDAQRYATGARDGYERLAELSF